jgi:hypothetical protein
VIRIAVTVRERWGLASRDRHTGHGAAVLVLHGSGGGAEIANRISPAASRGGAGGDVPTTEVVAIDLIRDFFAAHPKP